MNDNQADTEFVIHLVSKFNDDQLVEWHERAAIYEYEAKLDRDTAEYKAALDILSQIAHKLRRKVRQ